MATDLSISSNGHYLIKDGAPFFIINETIWYMAQRTTRANVDTLLDGLDGTTDSTKGCTNVITLCTVMAEAFSHVENPSNSYSHQAFNGGTVPDFSDPKIVAGGTPDAPNDYWDHLDYIVREIGDRDMYLNICPAWSKEYLDDAGGWGFTKPSVADIRAFGEFLGDRYKNDSHVFWLIGGDSQSLGTNAPHYRALAEGILKGVTGCTTCPDYDDESALWDDVLMTYHGEIYKPASDVWAITEKWCGANGIYSGRHYTLKPAYELSNPRPIYETEGYGFWDMSADQIKDARGHHYVHALQGGAGACFLNDYIWKIDGIWETRLGVSERTQFVLFKDTITAIDWWKLIPDNTIILSSNSPSEANFKEKMVAAKSSAEDMIAVYFHQRSPKTSQIDLNAITTNTVINGTWIHPKDGTTQSAGTHDVDDNPTFIVPTGWEDGFLTLIGGGPYSGERGINRPKLQFNQFGSRFRR